MPSEFTRIRACLTQVFAYTSRYSARKEGGAGKKTAEASHDSFSKRKVLKPPPAALDDEAGSEHWQIGRFSAGKLTGSGMMRMPDGTHYFGDFKEGKRHGAGMSVSGMHDISVCPAVSFRTTCTSICVLAS